MSNLPPLPLDTDAYLSDTGHLSTTQHGAYMLLLMAIWRSKDGWLPGDDSFLARASRQSLDKWRKMAPVIRALLIAKDGKVTQKRCKKIKDLTPVSLHRHLPRSKVQGIPVRKTAFQSAV